MVTTRSKTRSGASTLTAPASEPPQRGRGRKPRAPSPTRSASGSSTGSSPSPPPIQVLRRKRSTSSVRKARRSSLKSPEPGLMPRQTRRQRKQRAKSATFEVDPVATSIEYDVRAPPIAIEATLALAENPEVTLTREAPTPEEVDAAPSGDGDETSVKPPKNSETQSRESASKLSREASAAKESAPGKDSTTDDSES